MIVDLKEYLKTLDPADRIQAVDEIREALHEISEQGGEPVDLVRWVPLGDVEPNDYNPNSVARVEMGLLVRSIDKDGYTTPIVTIYDPKRKKYIIVDGFHRYFVMKNNARIRARCKGMLPVVVLKKDINERMAATIRHNRARGTHSITGMSNMVFQMLDNGMTDSAICNELGMDAEELVRLKHITGFSKLFADAEYNRAWVVASQIQAKKKYEEEAGQ